MLWQVRRLMFSSFTASVTFFYFLCLCVDSHLHTHTHTHKHVQTDSIAVKTNESFATLCMFVQYLMLLNDINIKASVWSETFPFCSPSLSLPPQPARHTHTLWLYFVTFYCSVIKLLHQFWTSVYLCVLSVLCLSVGMRAIHHSCTVPDSLSHKNTHRQKQKSRHTYTHAHTWVSNRFVLFFLINLQGLSECLPVCHDPFL